MASMHSYTSSVCDADAVAAFEWMSGLVSRVLTREREDVESLRALGEPVDHALDSGLDDLIDRILDKISGLSQIIENALGQPNLDREVLVRTLTETHDVCGQVQGQLVALLLHGDDGCVDRLVAEGLSNDAIATELQLTRSTVKAHVAAIMRKYGMSREQAAADIQAYLRRPEAVT